MTSLKEDALAMAGIIDEIRGFVEAGRLDLIDRLASDSQSSVDIVRLWSTEVPPEFMRGVYTQIIGSLEQATAVLKQSAKLAKYKQVEAGLNMQTAVLHLGGAAKRCRELANKL